MPEKIRIILVDDHAILTDGLRRLLESNARYDVLASFTSASFGLSYLSAEPSVDLVIVDHSMPDMNGVEFIKKVKASSPEIKIIMLSMHDEPSIIKDALTGGANGYVLKRAVSEELTRAIEQVMQGKSYWSADVGHVLVQHAKSVEGHYDYLTDREQEILTLITKELTNKEIAKQLFISERTVEVHRKNIMRKANCTNTVGLIKFAYAKGWLA